MNFRTSLRRLFLEYRLQIPETNDIAYKNQKKDRMEIITATIGAYRKRKKAGGKSEN